MQPFTGHDIFLWAKHSWSDCHMDTPKLLTESEFGVRRPLNVWKILLVSLSEDQQIMFHINCVKVKMWFYVLLSERFLIPVRFPQRINEDYDICFHRQFVQFSLWIFRCRRVLFTAVSKIWKNHNKQRKCKKQKVLKLLC